MKAWTEKSMFRDLVETNEIITSYLSAKEIDDAFDLNHHTRNVDTLFKRVGLA
jgi:adenylosuccinate lyase